MTSLTSCNAQIAPRKRRACFSTHPVLPVSADLLGLKPPFANRLCHQGTKSFPSLPFLPNAAEAEVCFKLASRPRWRGIMTLPSRVRPLVPDAKAKPQRRSHLHLQQVPPGPEAMSSLLGARATPRLPLIWYSQLFHFHIVHPFFGETEIRRAQIGGYRGTCSVSINFSQSKYMSSHTPNSHTRANSHAQFARLIYTLTPNSYTHV